MVVKKAAKMVEKKAEQKVVQMAAMLGLLKVVSRVDQKERLMVAQLAGRTAEQ